MAKKVTQPQSKKFGDFKLRQAINQTNKDLEKELKNRKSTPNFETKNSQPVKPEIKADEPKSETTTNTPGNTNTPEVQTPEVTPENKTPEIPTAENPAAATTDAPPEIKVEPPNKSEAPRRSSMFTQLHKATEQDKQGASKVNDVISQFANDAPPAVDEKGKVSDPETKRMKAWSRAGLYVNFADVLFMWLCCWIADEFTKEAQKKYMLIDIQKKNIRVSLFEVLILRDKPTNPTWDLVGAIFFGYVPLIGLAFAAKRDKKEQQKILPKYQNNQYVHEDVPNFNQPGKSNEQIIKEFLAEKQLKNDAAKAATNTQQQTQGNYAQPNPNPQQGNVEIVRDSSGEIKATRKGQHKGTCPRRNNKNAICNCK